MALAVFSQTHRYKPTAIEASRRYQSLLGIVQARIGQVGRCISNEADLDACLLAIFFMARYETVMFWPTEHFSPVSLALMQDWSHHDGAMAVLKTWFHSSDRKPATFLVKHTRRGLVKCALLRNLPLPDWLLDGSPFGEVGLELGYDRLIVRVVNLHYDMKSLLACAEFNITEAETLNDEANRLLEELEDWVAKFPKAWSFRRHDFPNFGPWPRKHFFSPILYSFDKPAYGAAWALYFAAKILTSSISLRLLDFVHDDASSISLHRHQWLDSSQAFREAIESLAATVPCCLGVFTVCDSVNSEYNQSMTVASTEKPIPPHLANLLIWCLTLPSIIPVMEQRQQAWFRSELAELGRLTGTGILQTAETGQWGSL
ncbi:MAG: hypothetical protein LQ350_005138 [Teloschistes chrysophthalmus]|nr:MAG: hypothetical protein LQ350_005138 [Niorma chrysophthalma]